MTADDGSKDRRMFPIFTFLDQEALETELVRESGLAQAAKLRHDKEQRRLWEAQRQPRRQLRCHPPSDSGLPDFTVTFFNGRKQRGSDLVAADHKARGDLERELAKADTMKLPAIVSTTAPAPFSTVGALPRIRGRPRTEKTAEYAPMDSPKMFVRYFPKALKAAEMDTLKAKDQADLRQIRPQCVSITAVQKRTGMKWGYEVDGSTGQLLPLSPKVKNHSTGPGRRKKWLKSVGHTSNKWANAELNFVAAKDQVDMKGDYVPRIDPEYLPASLPFLHRNPPGFESSLSPAFVKYHRRRGNQIPIGTLPDTIKMGKLLNAIPDAEWEKSKVAIKERRVFVANVVHNMEERRRGRHDLSCPPISLVSTLQQAATEASSLVIKAETLALSSDTPYATEKVDKQERPECDSTASGSTSVHAFPSITTQYLVVDVPLKATA